MVNRFRAAPKPTLPQALLMAGLLIFVSLVGMRTWTLVSTLSEVRAGRAELEDKQRVLEARNRDLQTQAQYVQDPENLETELRSRFNYKKPGESVIVVVPPQEETNE
jgi:cell division protein FtsB